MANTLGEKHKREYRMSFLGTKHIEEAPFTVFDVLERIGEDNTDLSRNQAWNVSSCKVVTGKVTATSSRGGASMSVDPFYCRKDSEIALLLQDIDKNEKDLDDIKHWYYEAKIDELGKTIYAFKQYADVKPISFGGPAINADAIPFELSLGGKKTELNFDFVTNQFIDLDLFRLKDSNGKFMYDSYGRALYVKNNNI